MNRSAFLACVLLVACERSAPRRVTGVTLAFDGTLTRSCNVVSLFTCSDAPFGTGVSVGATVSGHFTVDSNAQPVRPGPLELDLGQIRYYGVIADVTVNGVTLSDNDPWTSHVEIQANGIIETYQLNIANGFRSGTLAGLTVDFMQIYLQIVPARPPNTKPPQDAAAFQGGLDPVFGPRIFLKHQTSELTGLGAPGVRVDGLITAIH